MKKEPLLKKADAVRFLAALLLSILAEGLKKLFSAFPGKFFPAYRNLSKAVMKAFASVSSIVPFSLWDILCLCLILGLMISLVLVIIKKRRRIFTWVSIAALLLSFLFFSSTSLWMLNHYGPSLASEMGFEKNRFSEDELYEAAEYYTKKAAEYAISVERDENGYLMAENFSFKTIASRAGLSYNKLAEEYPVFSDGSEKPVKYLTVFNPVMLYTGTSGIFVEFTGESTVPTGNYILDMPHTMCHEVAHRLGIASEEDANFAAFLACASSDYPEFCYSGYYSAFVYMYNKLYEVNKNLCSKLINNLSSEGMTCLLRDADMASETYARYDTPVEKAGKKVNDLSLKSYGVTDGIRSYGNVVNDLIAWYQIQKKG